MVIRKWRGLEDSTFRGCLSHRDGGDLGQAKINRFFSWVGIIYSRKNKGGGLSWGRLETGGARLKKEFYESRDFTPTEKLYALYFEKFFDGITLKGGGSGWFLSDGEIGKLFGVGARQVRQIMKGLREKKVLYREMVSERLKWGQEFREKYEPENRVR